MPLLLHPIVGDVQILENNFPIQKWTFIPVLVQGFFENNFLWYFYKVMESHLILLFRSTQQIRLT